MSGPDNLRGVDYQIACSVLLILKTLADDNSPLASVQIESLDDQGEDIAFQFRDGRSLQIQLKKLAEGYNWTPAGLRPVLARFAQLNRAADCLFISDGSASRHVLPLKRFLEGHEELTDEVRDGVCDETFSSDELRSLGGRVTIRTRFH